MPAIVIVGAQWGDEGKGKATDLLGGSIDYCVRYQGGNNAAFPSSATVSSSTHRSCSPSSSSSPTAASTPADCWSRPTRT